MKSFLERTLLTISLITISITLSTKGVQAQTAPFNPPSSSNSCRQCLEIDGDFTCNTVRLYGNQNYNSIIQKIENMVATGCGEYVITQNEPDLENGGTDAEIAQRIRDTIRALNNTPGAENITIVIPPFAHNPGSLQQEDLNRLNNILQTLNNTGDLGKANFSLGVNIYTGLSNPIGNLSSMLEELRNLSSQYGINNFVISELGITTHDIVDQGCLSIEDWMAGTAALSRAIETVSPNTPAYTGLLTGREAQVPLYQNPDGSFEYGCSIRSEVDESTIQGILNGSIDLSSRVQPPGSCSPPDYEALTGCEASGPEQEGEEEIACVGEGAASVSCADCVVSHGRIEDDRSFLQQGINFFQSFFGISELEIGLAENKNYVREVNEQNSRIFSHASGQESVMSRWFQPVQNSTYNFYDPEITEAPYGGKLSGYPTTFPPGYAEQALNSQAIIEECKELSQQQIFFGQNGSPITDDPLEIAEENVLCAQAMSGHMANSVWATPQVRFSYNPPPGISEDDYLAGIKEERDAYLAQREREFLAKNYSTRDLNRLAIEKHNAMTGRGTNVSKTTIKNKNTIGKTEISKAVVNNNTETNSKTELIAPSENLLNTGIAACILPNNLSQKDAVCQTESRTAVVNMGLLETPTCEGSACSPGSTILQAYSFTGCREGLDCSDPSEQTTHTDSRELINRYLNSAQSQTALNFNSKNQLISSHTNVIRRFDINSGLKENLGIVSYTRVPPVSTGSSNTGGRAYNANTLSTDQSARLPIRFTTRSSTAGRAIETPQEEIIPGMKSASVCSQALVATNHLPPNEEALEQDDNAMRLRRLANNELSQCFAEYEDPIRAYCGTNRSVISNNTSNFKITSGSAGNTQDVNNSVMLDPNSDLQIKLATRFVDPAVILQEETISPWNPGGCAELTLGNQHNKSLIEIWYLPSSFESKVDDMNFWVENAYKLRPTVQPGGDSSRDPVNLEIDLRVNPGFYRIIKNSNNPCTRPGLETVGSQTRASLRTSSPTEISASYVLETGQQMDAHSTGYFKLESQETTSSVNERDTAFCAKVNMAPSSRAPEEPENIEGCHFPDYNLEVNLTCGGGSTNCEGGDSSCSRFRELAQTEFTQRGKDLFEQIMGRPFSVPSGAFACQDVFPSTIYETDCANVNNRDIGAFLSPEDKEISSGIANGQLDPPWESQTPLPTSGVATYYAPGMMQQVYNNRVAWGQIDPNACPECIGYVALMRKGDMGRKVWVKATKNYYNSSLPNQEVVTGPYLVIDMGATKDIPDLIEKNFVVDLPYEAAVEYGMYGKGPIPATVYDTNPR